MSPKCHSAFNIILLYLEGSKITLAHLCMFATGKPQFSEMKVDFHTNKAKCLRQQHGVLTLPVCHENYGDFKKKMDNACGMNLKDFTWFREHDIRHKVYGFHIGILKFP